MQEPRLWGPEETLHHPEAESQVVVSYLLWVLGRKLRPSGEAMLALNYGAISPAPSVLLFLSPLLSNKGLLRSTHCCLY